MVKPITRDVIFLAQPSLPATAADAGAADDLRDTLAAHAEGCVGMAANMIGVSKRIIVFDCEGTPMELFNPEILAHAGPYSAEEGCLSLEGTRTAKRWRKIKVKFFTRAMQPRIKTFTGWTAQIVQHEIDHCNGVII